MAVSLVLNTDEEIKRETVLEKWWRDEVRNREHEKHGHLPKTNTLFPKASLETDEIQKMCFSHFIFQVSSISIDHFCLFLYIFLSVDHRTTSSEKQFS